MSAFEEILHRVRETKSKASEEQIQKAYTILEEFSQKQNRISPHRYKDRAIEVARSLSIMQAEESLIISGLLHGVFSDFPEQQIFFQKTFGPSATMLLEKSSHIASSSTKTSLNNPELLRNMILTMAQDARVILLKLSERLYEMRNLEWNLPEEQQAFSRETLLIYAPIASRLGIYAMKAPLEDLSFFYLSPKEHNKSSQQMIQHEHYRDRIIRNASKKIQQLLEKQGISSETFGRVKHLYSISQKMKRKSADSIHEIHDVFAIRIIVSNLSECYAALGVIHEHFIPLPNLFKDYIAVPKPNGYRSLHTTVMGLSDASRKTFPVEIQIRTEEMNREAEFGVAAHWYYKEGKKKWQKKKAVDWLESLFETGHFSEKKIRDAKEVHRDDLPAKRIFVVTPKGDVLDFPEQATPIDFAFSIHSEIGLSLRMAKVNGKVVPLDHPLKSGDIIEVSTRRDTVPSQSWLSMCVTSKAKNRLRSFFREKDPDALLKEGRTLLNHQLTRLGHRELDPHFSLLQHFRGKNLPRKQREEILHHIGAGTLSPETVAREIFQEWKKREGGSSKSSSPKITEEKGKILISGRTDIPTKIASCCHPKMGDAILGFITRGKHITIHRIDCKILTHLENSRIIEARFSGEEKKEVVFLKITRTGDRIGILHDILSVFVKFGANVNNFVFQERSKAFATIFFSLEIQDFQDIFPIMNTIEKVQNITSVAHIENIPELPKI